MKCESLDSTSIEAIATIPVPEIIQALERGPCDFDVRQAFNAAVTYDIPAPIKNRFLKYSATRVLLRHDF